MKNNLSQVLEITKIYATYSSFTGMVATKEEIKKDIKNIDLEKALIILSRFSNLNEEGINHLKARIAQLYQGEENIANVVPFSEDNLLYTMKWFLAQGKSNPAFNYEITEQDLLKVFIVVLKLSDHIDGENEKVSNRDVENKIFRSTLQKKGKISDSARALIRQNIMFEEIARKPGLFKKNKFLDIHSAFEQKYGYSIKEYVSIVFMISDRCWKQISINEILNNTIEIDPEVYFQNTSKMEKANQIFNELIVEPLDIKNWAKETYENPYDYEAILDKPLFKINGKIICSSPILMENLLFEGLIYKIASCFNPQKRFFDFYGNIFEEYASQTLHSAANNSSLPYQFIGEFEFKSGKNKLDSSDAYIKLGKSLLIFECKGGRISKESKLQGIEAANKDYSKYVVGSLEQAIEAYKKLKASDMDDFRDVKKVFVFAVSSHPFPKVSEYQNDLESRNLSKEINAIKACDYIGLETIEVIANVIENHNKTIFSFIQNKVKHYTYLPYDGYFVYKNYRLHRTKWHQEDDVQ